MKLLQYSVLICMTLYFHDVKANDVIENSLEQKRISELGRYVGEIENPNDDFYKLWGDKFSSCSGVFLTYSSITNKDTPATSKTYKQLSNGARVAAAWHYAKFYKTGNAFGDYDIIINSNEEKMITRMGVYIESDDIAKFKEELVICASYGYIQEAVTKMVMDEAYKKHLSK